MSYHTSESPASLPLPQTNLPRNEPPPKENKGLTHRVNRVLRSLNEARLRANSFFREVFQDDGFDELP